MIQLIMSDRIKDKARHTFIISAAQTPVCLQVATGLLSHSREAMPSKNA